jgi:hypothetical protein
MEAVNTSETSFSNYKATWHNIPEDTTTTTTVI